MILQALCGYYDRLAESDESSVPTFGYAETGISSCIVINKEGDVTSVLSLLNTDGKKPIPARFVVPEQPKRSGQKPAPAFLCENAGFIFGIYDDEEGALYRFNASRELHRKVLGDLDDEGAQALIKFFDKRTLGSYKCYEVDTSPLDDGGNIIFRLQGDMQYLHERPAIKKAWDRYRAKLSEEAEKGQCLVTGEYGPVARLHGNVGGFGQDKPTLVGFNQNSFESYGKKQGQNAPVSELAAFKYITALNYLISDQKHCLNLHGDKVIIWAEREAPVEEALAACFFTDDVKLESTALDANTAARVRGMLAAIYEGRLPEDTRLDKNVRFYMLGIAANKTRLVVRFFHIDSFGGLMARAAQHYKDISVIGLSRGVSAFKILLETAVGRESKNIAPNLESALMQSILKGTTYPASLYHAVINRIRAEGGKDPAKARGYAINAIRAGLLKGYLNRLDRFNKKGERMTVALNKEERDIGYLLGRLFALLEKAQKDALVKVNASIVDKYLNSALATPQMVFPMLLTLSKKHISKAENYYMDKQIGEVVALLPSSGFPTNLNAEQQGRFIIGYYHQYQDLYTPKQKNNENKGNGGKDKWLRLLKTGMNLYCILT